MSITAARLGQSPLTLDWALLGGSGGDPARNKEIQEAWGRARPNLEEGFYDAPTNSELSQIEACTRSAQEILSKFPSIRDCLFIGIGGSSLGPKSLLAACAHQRKNKIRFHFLENPDPIDWQLIRDQIQPESTFVVVCTKSGQTFETLALFQVVLEWLGPSRTGQVIAITDPAKGELKKYCEKIHIPMLTIAPTIGGRFSIFTPVGLFPAALGGLNPHAFLEGASQVRAMAEKGPTEKNPLFLIVSQLFDWTDSRSVHILMPYSSRLKLISDWWVQLWGESLGKDGKGYTPLSSSGATDQHSLLQLMRDGPKDKVTGFICVDRMTPSHDTSTRVPPLWETIRGVDLPTFRLLQGKKLEEILHIEYLATAKVLSRNQHPNYTIKLSDLDERNLGALYFSFCLMTVQLAALMGVNAFDQPGVEEGKVYIRDDLSEKRLQDDYDDNSPVARLRRTQNAES